MDEGEALGLPKNTCRLPASPAEGHNPCHLVQAPLIDTRLGPSKEPGGSQSPPCQALIKSVRIEVPLIPCCPLPKGIFSLADGLSLEDEVSIESRDSPIL